MTTTKPDVDLAGIRKIVEAPFDHEQYVSNNLWLVEQVPALLDLVDARTRERDEAQSACTAWQHAFESIEAHLQDRIAMNDPAKPETYLEIIRYDVAHIIETSKRISAARWADYSRQQATIANLESRLTASSSGRNAGEVAREIAQQLAKETAWPVNYNQLWLAMAIESALEARDRAHAGREERMRKALKRLFEEAKLANRMGGTISFDVLVEADKVLADDPASPAPVTETNDV